MDKSGIESPEAHIMIELIECVSNTVGNGFVHFKGVHFQHIEYASNTVAVKTILRKSTSEYCLSLCDTRKSPAETRSPFNKLAQIIEGKGEIVVDGQLYALESGQGIIIRAYQSHFIKSNGHFKMILATIKNGHDAV